MIDTTVPGIIITGDWLTITLVGGHGRSAKLYTDVLIVENEVVFQPHTAAWGAAILESSPGAKAIRVVETCRPR